jgi:hypothetical protein
MKGNRVLGVKNLLSSKSMVAKERELHSVAVMQLHRIGKSPSKHLKLQQSLEIPFLKIFTNLQSKKQ